MKDTFTSWIDLTIFGESHGPAIGAVLDGIPAGIQIDETKIEERMDRRRAKGRLATQRHEADQVKILSGVFNGYTTGTAICLVIENKEQKSKDYSDIQYRLRPGHADYTAWMKYKGFQDYRGGGHFSGRLTAAITAAGAICAQILEQKGIEMASHLMQVYKFRDRPLNPNNLKAEQEILKEASLSILDEETRQEAQTALEQLASEGDSAGGIIETVITGVKPGVGEPFFDSVESVLAHLLFSVPAVKGIEFGDGFDLADKTGSQANDAFKVEDGVIKTKTNHNGGINGGITNGMPIRFKTAIKPTPSIYKEQDSVDFRTKEPVKLTIKGRHDPLIAQRAIVVIESMAAIALTDLMLAGGNL